MKKIIILVLGLVVIVAIYFIFIAEKEKPGEEPVNGVEVPVTGPIELPLYLEAEFVMRKIEDSGDVSYYATDASPSQVANFYAARFPDFETEEDSVLGYIFHNAEALSLATKLQSKSKKEFLDWKKANKGLVEAINISIYDPANEHYSELEDYKEKLEGKTVIIIAHF